MFPASLPSGRAASGPNPTGDRAPRSWRTWMCPARLPSLCFPALSQLYVSRIGRASRLETGALGQLRKGHRVFERMAAGVVVEVDEDILARLPCFCDALSPYFQRVPCVTRSVRPLSFVEPDESPLRRAPVGLLSPWAVGQAQGCV